MSTINSRLKAIELHFQQYGVPVQEAPQDPNEEAALAFISTRIGNFEDELTWDNVYAVATALYEFQSGKTAPDFSRRRSAARIVDGVAIDADA